MAQPTDPQQQPDVPSQNRILLRDIDFDFSMTDPEIIVDSVSNPFGDVVATDPGTTSDTDSHSQ